MRELWSCQGQKSGLKTTVKVPLKLMFFYINYLVKEFPQYTFIKHYLPLISSVHFYKMLVFPEA